MADKPKETGRDYGHKLYMGTTAYPEAIGRPSDKQYDYFIKRPHSDDKKPYYDDLYPEMEHYWTPYDPPPWGPNVPPYIPDTPGVPPHYPHIPGEHDPDDDPSSSFTGCVFTVPVGPTTINSGETSFHGLAIGNPLNPGQTTERTLTDPLTRLYVNYGPVDLLNTYREVNTCHLSAFASNCMAHVQAKTGFNPADYQKDASGEYYPVQIVAETASGAQCYWDLQVPVCPPDTELAWDWTNSAETIGQSDEVGVYFTGGIGPYEWTVSGSGYTLAKTETTTKSNTLISDADACGSAIITVTDACDSVVEGSVRGTEGYWNSSPDNPPADGCGLAGEQADWNIDCIGSVLENIWPVDATVIAGYQKQYHSERMAINAQGRGASATQGGCEANRLSFDYGVWDNPCLDYPAAWTLTKPPGDCTYAVRWQGNYEEFGGLYTSVPCYESGGVWYFRIAAHTNPSLDYWEWECA